MKFQIGDIICADGDMYRVAGRITYRNTSDGCMWDEYRLITETDGSERWLSVDDTYKEYSISKMEREPDRTGYHQVDQGHQVVVSCAGAVDVESGDRAFFIEYEDDTEELIISDEIWDDGKEVSTGYYLDEDEFWFVRSEPVGSFLASSSGEGNGKTSGRGVIVVVALLVLFFMEPLLGVVISLVTSTSTSSISKYLAKSDSYTHVTSITGNEKQKAKVYQAPPNATIDSVARNIIDAIEGNTQYVQQDDTETEGAIAILTNKEYCLIYESLQDHVLVQISGRKYAYTTDDDPYDSPDRVRRYYRSFYYSRGYSDDSSGYRSLSSPYSSYDGDTISYSYDNSYSAYSNSVRQSSIASRQSSGGGLSGGK